MQSGKARQGDWHLRVVSAPDFTIDQHMNWISSSDTLKQISLTFETKDAAIQYAEKHQLKYNIQESPNREPRRRAYVDNFLRP